MTPFNEFVTCFSRILNVRFFSWNFEFLYLEGCNVSFSVMINRYIGMFDFNRKLILCKKTKRKILRKNNRRFRNLKNMWWAWPLSKVKVIIWDPGSDGKTAFLSTVLVSNPVVRSRTDTTLNLPAANSDGYWKVKWVLKISNLESIPNFRLEIY